MAKKNTRDVRTVSSQSKENAWWICDEGHSYRSYVYNRTSKQEQSCPYCSGRKVLAGFNDLATTHPEIAKMWNHEKNGDLTPQDVTYGSGKKVWWVCDEGHEYQATIINISREKSTGCPYCSGRKALSGDNDFASLYPDLLSQWDDAKNNVDPSSIRPGSNYKAWWICDNGHRYTCDVWSKVFKNAGCPYCSGHKVLEGFNDLATTHPGLAKQWDYERNLNSSPGMISSGSCQSIWWICGLGHSWKANVYLRVVGNGCPECSRGMSVSSSEKEIAKFVTSLMGRGAVKTSRRNIIPPYELDIYIPEQNIAIEFNSLYWHTEERGKDKNYHYNKWKMCMEQGIQLITIWEDEWRDKQEIVKSMIAHKLGVGGDTKVFARKTHAVTIDKRQAKKFLNKHHIQGFSSGTIYIGLVSKNGDLVAVSSWRKNKNDLYLERYATSCTVAGGMGKLLKQGVKFAQENGFDRIVTFSDHQVSNGGLYQSLGFSKDADLYPDYKYVVKGERKHKFGYRLKRFREDDGLLYQDGLTEKELAKLNGLERVWDCGKTRWVMDID